MRNVSTYRSASSLLEFREYCEPCVDHLSGTSSIVEHVAKVKAANKRSPDLHPAIDHDIDARHVRTLFTGQEERNVRHFLGPAETSEQRLAEHRARPFGVLQLLSRLIGFDQARGDGIRANTVFSPLH